MKLILIFIATCISYYASAQTFNEWFKQKETQKKYLLQQIAGLKIYLDYAEKGYNIANKGLQTIHSIKKGDFSLHSGFISSLKQVNPAIRSWSRVTDIVAIQIKIIKQTKEVISAIKEQKQFTADEMNYCADVFDKLLEDCLQDIDDLISVTTSGELEMKDDERIERIEAIFLDIQDKYAFSSSFSDEMKGLSIQRLQEQQQIELSTVVDK